MFYVLIGAVLEVNQTKASLIVSKLRNHTFRITFRVTLLIQGFDNTVSTWSLCESTNVSCDKPRLWHPDRRKSHVSLKFFLTPFDCSYEKPLLSGIRVNVNARFFFAKLFRLSIFPFTLSSD